MVVVLIVVVLEVDQVALEGTTLKFVLHVVDFVPGPLDSRRASGRLRPSRFVIAWSSQ